MLSHVSIIISHLFYAFCWTNLLARCLVPVSCFCCFCISENLLLEIFSELDENLQGIFNRRKTPEDQRAALGATHRAGTASCRDPLGPHVGPAPAPGGSPRPPPTPINPQKTSRRAIISNPSSGEILKQFPAPCQDGDRPPEPSPSIPLLPAMRRE